VGTVLPGLTTAATLDRPYPPGVHGMKRRRKPSDYKIRLIEKQKCRWHFGILEGQFQRYVKRASQQKGPTGQNLLFMLQSRLDNIVWRMGLARTIPQARQMVVHRHIEINGKRVDRPSFQVKAGDIISIREKSRTKPFIQEMLAEQVAQIRPGWLDWDPGKVSGTLLTAPDRADLPFDLNENAIVEFYSQKL
jgi:small subunit ribosomal protein S4